MSSRIVVGMLAFNDYNVAITALDCYRRTKVLTGIEEYLFDPGFPGTDEDGWRRIAKDYGFVYQKITNRGVAGNWNQMILTTMAGWDDIFIGLDPDEHIASTARHWMFSMVQAFHKQRDAGFIGLSAPKDELEADGVVDHKVVRLLRFSKLMPWRCGAFHGRFFSKFPVEQSNAFYGNMNATCWKRMKYINQSFYLLKDFHYFHKESNYRLSTWKKESLSLKTALPYDLWLKDYCES